MSKLNIEETFPKGLLRPELFLGVASSVTARTVGVNLSEAGQPSGSHFAGGRYGRGEVGEFVLIEGQQSLLLGRISEIRLREQERRSIGRDFVGNSDLDALGQIQLLGCVSMDDLLVTAGVDAYPRLGDRIYAAPHRFIALLPRLMERAEDDGEPVVLNLGAIDVAQDSIVAVKPERLFGRHCAILGATGGGKSWTTARIIEECIRYKAKLILIDATGEYRDFTGQGVLHRHLGEPVEKATSSVSCSLPPTSFLESDFVALFEPAGKVQGPKMRAAIRSLRLAKLEPSLAPNGFIEKINQPKTAVEAAEKRPTIGSKLDDPRQPFAVQMLVKQIEQECVYPDGFVQGQRGQKDTSKWGDPSGEFSYCLSLVARINGVLTSPAFECVFHATSEPALTSEIGTFISGSDKLLRICLSGIAYEFHAREIIANVIGRHLLTQARGRAFQQRPTVVFLDEAHNFLGRQIGADDYAAKLDAFELIAKEGRKYGLNICLASQRPRDITEGVLSQMGTLIVHRLTNDRDREVVERACGEIDRAASAFLPNLRPGEAAIIGTDFPIPLTIQIHEPVTKPKSDGPDFQRHWAKEPNQTEIRAMEEAAELANYLPLSFKSPKEQEYIEFLWDAFETNCSHGKYQFAFLAYHMLAMSFVYFKIWQIKQTAPKDFEMGLIGFGKDIERSLLEATSPFVFSTVNERSIMRLFKLIACDNGKIGAYAKLVDDRNETAHSNGNIFYSTEAALDAKIDEILRVVAEIEEHSRRVIEDSYRRFLLQSQEPEVREYPDAADQIREVLIHGNYLSQRDVDVCLAFDTAALAPDDGSQNFIELRDSLRASYGIE